MCVCGGGGGVGSVCACVGGAYVYIPGFISFDISFNSIQSFEVLQLCYNTSYGYSFNLNEINLLGGQMPTQLTYYHLPALT